MSKRFFLTASIVSLWLLAGTAFAVTPAKTVKPSPEFQPIRDILALPEKKIDLAVARLTIEKLVDPSIDIDANLKLLDQLTAEIKQVPRYQETTEGKLNGLIQYIYHPGKWNDNNPFHYDFDDPLGTGNPKGQYLSNYLKTRRGQCISMPILLIALSERLGLDLRLSQAPLHLFSQLHDKGHVYNVEATAGGLKATESYVREFLITPQAQSNGIYLRSLTKKETVTVMLEVLARHYLDKGNENADFDRAFELTELMLAHYPNNITAMLIRGNTWGKILERDEKMAIKRGMANTPMATKHFEALLERNQMWYAKAEQLGWREPPKDYDERYLKMVDEARKTYE